MLDDIPGVPHGVDHGQHFHLERVTAGHEHCVRRELVNLIVRVSVAGHPCPRSYALAAGSVCVDFKQPEST